MKIHYDPDNDAIYIRLSEEKVVESEEKEKDVIVDYNDKDEIVGIEILNVKTKPYDIDIPMSFKKAS